MNDGSRTSYYEFDLDPARIAQRPPEVRGESKLLVADRATGSISHRTFRDLAELIPAGDALVVNTTRVMRARLIGKRDNGAAAEVFLLRATGPLTYEAMVHPGGKLKPGKRVTVAPDLIVEIESTTERRTRNVKLISQMPVETAIERYGHVPLPPYIKRGDEVADAERYQTVYARERGSVAVPGFSLRISSHRSTLPSSRRAIETRLSPALTRYVLGIFILPRV